MKLQVLQLEPFDDVTSVRDRLSFVKADGVLLVWPRTGRLLSRKLDLVLIQREAARRGARLALVTQDHTVIDQAAELNISTFPSVEASRRTRWKRPRNKVFVDRSDRPDDAPDAYELRLTESRLIPLTPAQQRRQNTVRAGAAVLLGLVLFAVVYLILPGADVIIYPAQTQIDTTIKLVGDPSITSVDVENGRVPATLLTLPVSAQASIPSTGLADVPNTLASGTIVFINQTDAAQFIPSGTIVSTYGAKPARFRTVNDSNIEGGVGQTQQVTIEAAQESAGPAGNIDANLITVLEGPLNGKLAVRNDNPTRGGTIRQQGIVTKEDRDRLLLLAREKLKQTALGEFGARLSGTQFIAPDSIQIVEERPEWTTYSAFAGDAVATLTLDMRANIQAVVIDEQLARQAAFANLSSKIPPGRQISPGSVTFIRGAIQNTDPKKQVAFFMSASGNVAIAVNTEQWRQRLAGMNTGEALQLLHREILLAPRRDPQIRIFPDLFGRLPVLPARITITVQE